MSKPIKQYWTEDQPCAYCPATSNTSHTVMCPNDGLYDEDGRPRIQERLDDEPWEQLKLG